MKLEGRHICECPICGDSITIEITDVKEVRGEEGLRYSFVTNVVDESMERHKSCLEHKVSGVSVELMPEQKDGSEEDARVG